MNGPHSIPAAGRVGAGRAAPSQPQRTIVTGDPLAGWPSRLAVRPSRLADRLSARLFGASLDRQLAAGREPESSPLLAARAQHIVALRSRRRLAGDWEHLLRSARRARGVYQRAVPVRRDRIIAAEPAIRELARRMTAPLPVPARGVAMATALLTDPLGPVFNPHSAVSLAAALEAVMDQLDPALPLMSRIV